MGFSFLTPLFLFGAAALGIPILIHLIQRDRKQVVRFPSLMFLERIPYRSVRRQTIRHWALFMVRAGALLLLVAAFARPLFTRGSVVDVTGDGPREVVLVVDRSYSMGAGDRFEAARDQARRLASELGPQDRLSLVVFGQNARTLLRSTDPLQLEPVLEDVTVSAGTTRFGPALKLAQAILEQSRLPRREAYLISDFQRIAWTGDEDVEFPVGARLLPVLVGEPVERNVAVVGVGFRRTPTAGRERVVVSARIANLGSAPVADVPVRLLLGQQEIGVETVSLGPSGSADGTAEVAMPPFTLSESGTRASILLPSDALPADDRYDFVLSPEGSVGVLVVRPSRGGRDESLFLRRALEVGETRPFQVRTKRMNATGPADLTGVRVVILNGSDLPNDAFVAGLRTFVEEGGGLLVALDEASSWPTDDWDLLPGRFAGATEPTASRGGALGFVDFRHPIFELFSTPRSGDFTSASFFRFRRVEPDSTATVLARFDDGSVALAEARRGRGRVLLWATGLDNFWNDLALQPVYVPFVHSFTGYLAGSSGAPPWRRVDEIVELSREFGLRPTDGEDAWIVRAPSGATQELVANSEGARFLQLEESGFYELRPEGTAESAVHMAVNPDLAESNMARLDPEELAASVASSSVADQGAVTPEGIDVRRVLERRQRLWWYLLLGVFALLAVDTILSNRLSRRPA